MPCCQGSAAAAEMIAQGQVLQLRDWLMLQVSCMAAHAAVLMLADGELSVGWVPRDLSRILSLARNTTAQESRPTPARYQSCIGTHPSQHGRKAMRTNCSEGVPATSKVAFASLEQRKIG